MTTKLIYLEPSKCNGCGDCEIACSIKCSGLNDPAMSCIRIVQDTGFKDFYLPVLCMQCTQPSCIEACPREAIYLEDSSNRILIDYSLCVGCGMCYSACPFGAMHFDDLRGRAFKCDLCGGKPECVRSCEPAALTFVENIQSSKIVSSAEKIFNAFHGQS